MGILKQLIFLANSRKLSGRCIAGKEIASDDVAKWVRPVSARKNEEVSEYERQYPDGSDPKVLDIIDIPLLKPHRRGHQTENWLLDPDYYWEKRGEMSWDDLGRIVDPIGPLWDNSSSTWNGKSDRITAGLTASLTDSLRLIYVDRATLSVFAPGRDFGNLKRRVQARFQHLSHEYRLWITDPVYEKRYLQRPDQDYELGECYLTISIGEPMNDGSCYKLVAAIIERNIGHQTL